MSVYVDRLVEHGTVKGGGTATYWCHLMADSLEELHDMAAKIGLQRRWFQGLPDHRIPHYDVTP